MSLPKKRKYNSEIINPNISSGKYNEYSMERIEQLLYQTDEKSTYLPRTIKIEDIDINTFEFINKEFELIIDGKVVPIFYMENERWGEFSKTWMFMDEDKNVPTPYITVRRVDKKPGTRLGERYNVAQNKSFTYLDVPILDDGQIINLRFKIPEPINVDLFYEISLFTKFREDVNDLDEIILGGFASRQAYVTINKSYIPVILDEITEPKTIENIEGDKFYISKYKIKAMGYIQDEKNFKIVKTTRKPKIDISIDTKTSSRGVKQKTNQSIIPQPTLYDVIVSNTLGGNTFPESGTYKYPSNSLKGFFALESLGYRFVNWIINGGKHVTNPIALQIDKTYSIIAEFIKQYALTTSVSGNGTITPASGTYDDGETIAVTATPDPEHELDRVDITDAGGLTQITAEAFNWVIDSATTMVAYFQAILQVIQDLFSSLPEQIGGLWKFKDQSLNNNDLEIKNTRVGRLDGSGIQLRTLIYQVGGDLYDETFVIKFNDLATTNQIIHLNGSWAVANKGFYYRYVTSDGGTTQSIQLASSDGSTRLFSTVNLTGNKFKSDDFVTLHSHWSGVEGEPFYFEIDGQEYSTNENKAWVGNSAFNIIYGGYLTSGFLNADFSEIDRINSQDNLKHLFQKGYGSIESDASGNGNNSTIHLLNSNYWANYSNTKPHLLVNGYSNVLVCESGGLCYYDLTKGTDEAIAAYSTNEFSFIVQTGNDLIIEFSSNVNNQSDDAYLFQTGVSSSNRLYIKRRVNGVVSNLLGTSSFFITYGTHYTIRSIRTKASEFTFYIKGGIYADWTLLNSSTVGSNPFTDTLYKTEKYISVSCGIGDQVGYFKKNGESLEIKDFVTLSGTYNLYKEVGVDGLLDVKGMDLEYKPVLTENTTATRVKQVNIICYGNSITKGTISGFAPYTYPFLLNYDLYNYSIKNLGVDGRTGETMLANFNSEVLPLVNPDMDNILIYFENVNDLAGGATVQQTYEHIRDIGLLAKTAGLTVIVGTGNKVSLVIENDNEAVNVLIRSNYQTFSDYLLDIHSITEWQDPSTYTADGLHPLDYQPLSDSVKTIIDSISFETVDILDKRSVLSDTGNTYDGLQVNGIELNATFNDIQALENSSTIEITKDANTVSRLIIKQ